MFAKSTIALASLALFLNGAAAADCARKYTVKAGDYCDSISAANSVSTYQLGALNAGVINERCDNLVPGQEICLATTEVDCKETVVVTAGDTCNAIWKETGADVDTFYKNNPQVTKECRNIYIDEVLCVSKVLNPPPVPDVPIHTGPPPSEAVSPVPVPDAPTATPAPEPAKVAPAPGSEEEECEDEYEEIEVVENPTGEDLNLPFCDELEGWEGSN
ncbi:hypothetical protein BKA70DRAFT_525822 [Coprinopsis sp. MPI-PUGE-AT-0042]|nr:hypothetical protein BKA70DRAFT_525822 [Coprinopsis sp. MPI-PUGE-AT-0042]